MSPFALSLEQWVERGGSEESWRKRAHSLWATIRASKHWHDGRPCKDVGCPNGAYLAPPVSS